MNPKDRLQHARDLQLCFNCFSPHKFADCQSTQTCRTDGCSKKHHTLLHNSSTYNSRTQRETANRNSRQHDDTTNCSTSISRRKSTGHIPTLSITISHDKHRVHAYAMLDCGSKLTLLKSSVAPPTQTRSVIRRHHPAKPSTDIIRHSFYKDDDRDWTLQPAKAAISTK